jgi:hypothetical protein
MKKIQDTIWFDEKFVLFPCVLIYILKSSVSSTKMAALCEMKNAAMGGRVHASLAPGIATILDSAILFHLGSFGSSTSVVQKVIREGFHQLCKVKFPDQLWVDDDQSNFLSVGKIL